MEYVPTDCDKLTVGISVLPITILRGFSGYNSSSLIVDKVMVLAPNSVLAILIFPLSAHVTQWSAPDAEGTPSHLSQATIAAAPSPPR